MCVNIQMYARFQQFNAKQNIQNEMINVNLQAILQCIFLNCITLIVNMYVIVNRPYDPFPVYRKILSNLELFLTTV